MEARDLLTYKYEYHVWDVLPENIFVIDRSNGAGCGFQSIGDLTKSLPRLFSPEKSSSILNI